MISTDFITSIMEEMARRCNEPFDFIIAMTYAGFNSQAEKRQAIKAWNRIHKDRQLPLPPNEVIP